MGLLRGAVNVKPLMALGVALLLWVGVCEAGGRGRMPYGFRDYNQFTLGKDHRGSKDDNAYDSFSWLKRVWVRGLMHNRTVAYEAEAENARRNNMFGGMLKATKDELGVMAADPDGLLRDLAASGIKIVPEMHPGASAPAPSEPLDQGPGPYVPLVIMHGMGDAAENPGMTQIARMLRRRLEGSAVVNVALGKTRAQDASNTFFMTMDDQVGAFAERVRGDPRLAGGFNALGFSQGNLIIRGYVERYNDPPVRTFVSMHGPLAGVAGFPNCQTSVAICKLIDRSLGTLAYTPSVQEHLAQANYYRDPKRLDDYKAGAIFLPDVNNEAMPPNATATYATNFATLSKLVMVMAAEDTEVVPKESEWFGYFQDGSRNEADVQAMEDTEWYKLDSFGLRTLHKAGRVERLSTPGNHLEFSQDFLLGLADEYLKAPANSDAAKEGLGMALPDTGLAWAAAHGDEASLEAMLKPNYTASSPPPPVWFAEHADVDKFLRTTPKRGARIAGLKAQLEHLASVGLPGIVLTNHTEGELAALLKTKLAELQEREADDAERARVHQGVAFIGAED